ncbi:MAG: ROK family transcriptional regulator [Actinomycetota bacterium]
MVTEAPRLTPLEIRQEIPGSNHARLLQLLYQQGDLSRAELARAVGFTKATVSSLVAEMISEGLVVETRQRAVDGPGRPAVDLNIDRQNWCVVAVDLSPDHEMRGAVIDLTGTVHARASVKTDGALGDAALDKTIQLIDELRGLTDRRLLGIGICAPGIVDLSGRVLASHNLGWSGLPLQDVVETHAGLPTCVVNDANAAALAERDLQGFQDDLILVKIGFGIGGAIIANGTLIHGPRFTAGEIGHVAIGDGDGPLCVCGRRGCLEATMTLPKLEAQLREASSEDERATALHAGGYRLGIALAPLIGSLGIEAVVVTGLPESIAPPVLRSVREALAPRLTEDLLAALNLRTTQLGDDITLQGATILVMTRVLGIP